MSRRPILISMGEPAGVGPEIAVKAWAALGGAIADRPIFLVGDRLVFQQAAQRSGVAGSRLDRAIVPTNAPVQVSSGLPAAGNAGAVTEAIERGVQATASGEAAALVTAPIHKAILTGSGFPYPGHTEYLAALTNCPRAVMMLASHAIDPPLRVVPLTVHVSLRAALQALNVPLVTETASIIIDALRRDFGIRAPRLALSGLNPHAGESGTMGMEEEDVLIPAVTSLRAQDHEVVGPLSADTMFRNEARASYDAALCMYHDQALIPIKTLAFWTGVNVTLGLPIVRTSPDHGTALDIAGKDIADPASMIAAVSMAAQIADRRGL